MKPALLLLATLQLAPTTPYTLQEPDSTLERGRELCKLFFERTLEPIWELFSPQAKALFGEIDGLEGLREQVELQVGKEKKVVSESADEAGGLRTYVRVSQYDKYEGTIDFIWQLDAGGKIVSIGIRPSQKEAESRFLEYQTKTPLRLPFEGAWDVFWGGRSLSQNYHTAYPDQRFAYDILIMKDGVSHAGDGKRNEDFFCYGKRLLAPGPGKVVSVADDVADNSPGVMNPKQPLGNHLILDHGNGEFSFLAHFQKGSVQFAKGEQVKAGDFLGLAGNSGNTSEPHLHYHLQNTPTFNKGEGLPAQFLDYLADGAAVERGEPTKGQTIQAR